jgi:hypothetical protein
MLNLKPALTINWRFHRIRSIRIFIVYSAHTCDVAAAAAAAADVSCCSWVFSNLCTAQTRCVMWVHEAYPLLSDSTIHTTQHWWQRFLRAYVGYEEGGWYEVHRCLIHIDSTLVPLFAENSRLAKFDVMPTVRSAWQWCCFILLVVGVICLIFKDANNLHSQLQLGLGLMLPKCSHCAPT